MHKIITCLLIMVLIASCKKSETIAPEVWVRIENAASISLNEVAIGDVNYGTIPAGAKSGYMKMNSPIYAPQCLFNLDGEVISAGYVLCATPPPSAYPEGYYTFRVEPAQGYFIVKASKD